ncbi:piriformospora indica-insensitive protein 2-like [Zingiber officinale]|uniref:Piriformospora indica-insensitive protein 2 n=1 Tax=Zingiber officinale TaxID=94328 RepID=A0A8J5ECK5_ZINOF|nr:piriformospora indica-insensitive protein 2-like [Zingiber officinale]KAG6471832.1 hypothetical protein ZIOFF_069279 [Zingiber officinale]
MRRGSSNWVLLLLSFLVFHVSLSNEQEDSTAPMLRAEQEALYLLIQDLVGKWWNGSELYPDPCGWTQIQGVSCDVYDGKWHVTGLTFGSILDDSLECSEDASLSPLLFEFEHLKSLSFFGCFVSSHHKTSIPSSHWEKLAPSLETLEFRSNPGLVGEIPASITRLTKLQSLVLVDNSLSGNLPQELGHLVQLKRLALAGSHFSGQIPASIGSKLSELLILDMSRNSLTGSLPSSLGAMNSLLKLDLSDNFLHGSLPQELGQLKCLTLLDLRGNKFSHGLPQALHDMVSLQDLLLSNNPLGGNLMGTDWGRLTNLSTLDLSNTNLSGEIPESIVRVKRLRFLALDNNNLSGCVPTKLADLPDLTALYLNGNNLAGELKFSEAFHRRMGRRFAFGGNPHSSVAQYCKQEKSAGSQGKGKGRIMDDQSSSVLTSLSFPASSINVWLGVAVQELLVVIALILLL